jgi:hypothetical protein
VRVELPRLSGDDDTMPTSDAKALAAFLTAEAWAVAELLLVLALGAMPSVAVASLANEVAVSGLAERSTKNLARVPSIARGGVLDNVPPMNTGVQNEIKRWDQKRTR